MKKKLFVLIIILISIKSYSFCQDTIIFKNGDEIKVKILELLPDLIKYKKRDNQDGPSYTEYKSNIFMIKYSNGTKDLFKSQELNNSSNSNVSSSNDDMKKNDAINKIENYIKNKIPHQIIELVKFQKTNGVMKNVFGQNIYMVSFDLNLKFISNGWLVGNNLEGYWRNSFNLYSSQPNLSASGQQFMYQTRYYPVGSSIILGCEAEMENTDNGFELKTFTIKTEANLGISGNYSNSSGNVINNSSQIKKHNYEEDIILLSKILDTSKIDNVDLSYFIGSYKKKNLLGTSTFRIEQKKNYNDKIIVYHKDVLGGETIYDPMFYYKGAIFFDNNEYGFLILTKSEEGIKATVYVQETLKKFSEMKYKKE